MPRQIVNFDRDRDIARRVIRGETSTSLAREHGITPQRVHYIVHEMARRAGRPKCARAGHGYPLTIREMRDNATNWIAAIDALPNPNQ